MDNFGAQSPQTPSPGGSVSERRVANSNEEKNQHGRVISPQISGVKRPNRLASNPEMRDFTRKRDIMTTLPPKFSITPDEIARVVARFYASIRAHPGLGPVFAAHVADWPAHEAKIAGFWRNAILHERSYDGNPLAAHRQAGNVQPGMFEPWLALFDAALAEELSPEQAAAWSALAHRIGRSLRAGVSDVTKPGEVPIFK